MTANEGSISAALSSPVLRPPAKFIYFKYNLKQSKQTIMNINFGKEDNVVYSMKPDFYYY